MANETKKTAPSALGLTESHHVFRRAYTRTRCALFFAAQGRTKQSFQSECDINTIMSRYLKTGVLDFVTRNEERYGDVTGIEYQDAMNLVAESRTMFNELPALIRSEFGNDPAAFLTFVSNPDNRPEMAQMGLLTPEAVERLTKAAPASVVNPAGVPEGKAPLDKAPEKAPGV